MKFRFVFWDVLPCKNNCRLTFQSYVLRSSPWWWRQHVPLKRRYTIIFTRQYIPEDKSELNPLIFRKTCYKLRAIRGRIHRHFKFITLVPVRTSEVGERIGPPNVDSKIVCVIVCPSTPNSYFRCFFVECDRTTWRENELCIKFSFYVWNCVWRKNRFKHRLGTNL
jgi:hypothetical protein